MLNTFKFLNKFDVILIVVLIIIAIFFKSILDSFVTAINPQDALVRVNVNGTTVFLESLQNEGEYIINVSDENNSEHNHNTIVIKDNKVNMVQSTCPDQLCVYQKYIEYSNEAIVCLPNKMIVEIIGAAESEIDSVSN